MKEYEKAKRIFLYYNGNYYLMERDGIYSDYKSYEIPKYYEKKWLHEKIIMLLFELKEENDVRKLLEKNLKILELIFELDKKTIHRKFLFQFRKNLNKMDMFSKVVLIETILDKLNKKNPSKETGTLKKIISKLLVITQNENIISDDFKDEKGKYLNDITENEVLRRYSNIVKIINNTIL